MSKDKWSVGTKQDTPELYDKDHEQKLEQRQAVKEIHQELDDTLDRLKKKCCEVREQV